MIKNRHPFIFIVLLLAFQCSLFAQSKNTITQKPFGTTPDGEKITMYTLTNSKGLSAKVINYGATLTHLFVPDRDGKMKDVVLGYDNLEGYVNVNPYFGSTVGRYAGRIKDGKFTLNGKEYQVSINNGPNHLHGGKNGFNKKVWTSKIVEKDGQQAVIMTYLSPDGEEGFPGNLTCTVVYRLNDKNELVIDLKATTDKPTIVNMTNHSYFNLAGFDGGSVADHQFMVNADYYVAAESEWLIPTGEIRSVKGTAHDFTTLTKIGKNLVKAPSDFGGNNEGYDLNFVLKNFGHMETVAQLYEPKSGRLLEVVTTEPALQFYTGNFLDGSNKGKSTTYEKHTGICLEPQHIPNTPNYSHFPSCVLNPGEVYAHTFKYRFGVK